MNIPPGCAFHPRCPMARTSAADTEPPLYDVEDSTGAPATSGGSAVQWLRSSILEVRDLVKHFR